LESTVRRWLFLALPVIVAAIDERPPLEGAERPLDRREKR
jgi:hypothetical protein